MTLAEVAISAGITTAAVGTAVSVVVPLHRALDHQRASAEVHQRGRAMFERLQYDLRNAGIWTGRPISAAPRAWPAVLPFDIAAVGPGRPRAQNSAITILRPLPRASRVEATSPLSQRVPTVTVRQPRECRPSAGRWCELRADTTVMIVDPTGRSNFLRVTGVVTDTATVTALDGGPLPSYPVGSAVIPIQIRTYHHDANRAQLRYRDGWMTSAPVTNHVAGISFRYFGDPLGSRSSTSASAASPSPCRSTGLQDGGGSGSGQVEVTLAELGDGPWCGARPTFDADLFRVRRVRVEMRLQSPLALRRRGDLSSVSGPGSRTSSYADLTAHFEVTIRNVGWRW